MRKIKIALAAAWLSVSASAFAADDDRAEAARTYVETPTVQKMMDGMFSPQMANAMITNLVSQGKSTEEQRVKASEIVSQELQRVRSQVLDIMVNATAETFTLEEIKALTAFYGSQEGQSIAAKMQPFMAQYLQQIGPVLQQAQSSIAQRVRDEIGQ